MSPDRKYQRTALAMQDAANSGLSPLPLLQKTCPDLCRQIRRDAELPALFAFWGRSVNVDENTSETIVHPAILQVIGDLADVPMRGRFVHAGLQHTYGYLFSSIQTPYGAKRDRWLSEKWERGFGLERSLLGDRPRSGTLLANATWFLGQIAYRGEASWLHRLNELKTAAAPDLVKYPFEGPPIERIVEKVSWRDRDIRIVTDLVPFSHSPKNAADDRFLLVYSIQISRAMPRLITAFPIQEQMATQLKAAVQQGRVEVRLRFNAYVPGLFGITMKGRRRLEVFQNSASGGRKPPGNSE